MPLWIIYHPQNTFESEETKTQLAKAITDIYTPFIPSFYVNVLFQPFEPYVSGVARPSPHDETNNPGPDSSKPFIRVTIQNFARKLPTDTHRDRFLSTVDKALKPFIEDAGYDWKYTVIETSRDLWKIQGLVPPMTGSEAEAEARAEWARENRAVPFEREKGCLPALSAETNS